MRREEIYNNDCISDLEFYFYCWLFDEILFDENLFYGIKYNIHALHHALEPKLVPIPSKIYLLRVCPDYKWQYLKSSQLLATLIWAVKISTIYV